MKRAIFLLLIALSIPITGMAFAAFVGAGAVRHGDPIVVTLCAIVMVVVPGIGLATATPRGYRASATAFGGTLWSLACLSAFPLYFPDERGEALETGLTVTGFPQAVLRVAAAIERDLPVIGEARKPPALARPVASGTWMATRQAKVELPVEQKGNALRVTVTFTGPSKEPRSYRMVLDTGATLTTLPRKALEDLGVTFAEPNRSVRLGTASGEIDAPISVLNEVHLDTASLHDVTIAACEPCGGAEDTGLLGLNVLEQFVMTVDRTAGRVQLEPRPPPGDRLADVSPWAEVRATSKQWIDGRLEVDLTIDSWAPKAISKAEVAIHCSSSFIAEFTHIGAKSRARTSVTLPRGQTCDSYTVEISRATW